MECTQKSIIGIPEGEKRENGAEAISKKIIAKNFPKIMKDMKSQIQEKL